MIDGVVVGLLGLLCWCTVVVALVLVLAFVFGFGFEMMCLTGQFGSGFVTFEVNLTNTKTNCYMPY